MEVNTLEGNKKGILVHGFVEVYTLEGEALASKSTVTILIVKRSEVFSTWKLTFACLE